VDVVDVVVTETLLVEDAPASEEEVREVVEWGNIVSIGLEVVGLIETRWLRSRSASGQRQFWRAGDHSSKTICQIQ